MPNDYNQYQPYTGFFTQDANTAISQDLGQRYVTKSYLLDVYPNIASQLGNRTSPGLFTWGNASIGQLGYDSFFNVSSPIQVGTLTNWKQVSSGGAMGACIKTDGTLWTWGSNVSGQLGLNDTTNRSSPVQVGSLTNWKQVDCGDNNVNQNITHTACIKTDGTLWTWGSNVFGQLGLNDTTNRSSPVQVGSLTNWKQVDCGQYHTACIKTDGTLWTWGYNASGELGLQDIAERSSPVQVGSLTNWKQVGTGGFNTVCVKVDGTLWTWGVNFSGQLGLEDTTARSSPVQVGSLTNWKQVSVGKESSGCIKTDGTLWTWGGSTDGQLGIGSSGFFGRRSSPVQVGTLTNWKQVNSGQYHFVCIKTDGTLWIWGNNGFGRLGLGDSTNRSSPVQVGSLTNFKQASAATHTSCILDATF